MNLIFCFFKQKTAYEMRISDWSSDVCASDLQLARPKFFCVAAVFPKVGPPSSGQGPGSINRGDHNVRRHRPCRPTRHGIWRVHHHWRRYRTSHGGSEENTSELQSLMPISYVVFCLKNKKTPREHETPYQPHAMQ